MKAEQAEYLLEKLRVLMRESYDVFDDQQKCCDLTYSQCHTLTEIGAKREVSLVDLASSLGLDTSTLSRTIQGLVVLGLVTRTTNPKDRRYVNISLSKQGRKVYEAIGNLYYEFMTRVFGLIPARKHEAVLESLGLLSDAMKQANGPGRGRK
ncbi:MAG: MarR family transcriptional regulator [Candidatus Aminicenantales bacterium]